MTFRRNTSLAWLATFLMLWANLAGPLLAYPLPIKGYPKIEVNGNNTLTLNLSTIEGSETYYHDDNYGQDRVLNNSSNLDIRGELFKNLFLNANVAADHYTPNRTRWNLRYEGGTATTTVGEFPASIGGNPFVTLNRSLKGVQVDTHLKKGTLTLVTSELEAPVRTDTFYGRNVSGPYYLNNSPIVDSSEVVTVNNQVKERMKDYTLDYSNGILNFSSNIIIGPADRVVVSYEAAVEGTSSGKLYAIRGSYPISNSLNVGVTHFMLQGKNGNSSSTSSKTDTFQGTGSPGPFHLSSGPIVPESEVVTFDLIKQVRGIAYTIDYTNRTILFSNGYIPPAGTSVKVQYLVTVASASIGADRSVTGVDANWMAGKGLNLTAQVAKSNGPRTQMIPSQKYDREPFILTNPDIKPYTQQVFMLHHTPVLEGSETVAIGTRTLVNNETTQEYVVNYETGELRLLSNDLPFIAVDPRMMVSYTTKSTTVTQQGDSAMALGATYARNKLNVAMNYQHVDPGFAPLERVGYRNTRQALDWSTSYSPNADFTFRITGDSRREPYNPYVTSTSSDETLMEEKNRMFAVDYHHGNWPTLSLWRSTRDAAQVGGGSLGDNSISDNLLISWVRNAISATFNLNRTTTDSRQARYTQDAYSTLPDTSSDAIYDYQATTNNASLNLNYQPSDRMNVGVNLAANKIKSNADGSVTTTGGNTVSANAMYRMGNRLTFNANLASTKTDATKTAVGTTAPALTTRNLMFGADWQAAHNLSIGTAFTTDRTSGGDYSNSKSNTLSANFSWQPNTMTALNGYWSRQQMQYLQEEGNTVSNIMGLNTQVGPIKKATINLGAQYLWGKNAFGVTQLWMSEGQSHRAVFSQADVAGAPTVNSNQLLTLDGKISYQIGSRQDVFLLGETTQGSGYPSKSSRNSFGLGWNYHISDNLVFTLDARRLIYNNIDNPDQDYRANQLNAQLSLNF